MEKLHLKQLRLFLTLSLFTVFIGLSHTVNALPSCNIVVLSIIQNTPTNKTITLEYTNNGTITPDDSFNQLYFQFTDTTITPTYLLSTYNWYFGTVVGSIYQYQGTAQTGADFIPPDSTPRTLQITLEIPQPTNSEIVITANTVSDSVINCATVNINNGTVIPPVRIDDTQITQYLALFLITWVGWGFIKTVGKRYHVQAR